MPAIAGKCPHCGGALYRDGEKIVRCRQCEKTPGWCLPPRTEKEIARVKRSEEARVKREQEEKIDREIREKEIADAAKAREERKVKEAAERQTTEQEQKVANTPAPSFLPADWDDLPIYIKTQFYDDNKGLILRTLQQLGYKETNKKLGIPKATLVGLKRRWTGKPRPPAAPVKPPHKGRRRTKTGKFPHYERNKEAMIADYRAMKLADFFRKYHISSATWSQLRQAWGLIGNRQLSMKKRTRTSTPAADLSQEKLAPAKVEVKSEPFHTEPLNKRTGTRAIWRF